MTATLTDIEKQTLDALVKTPAPQGSYCLHSAWGGGVKGAPFLNYLVGLRFEIEDILERGDSLVPPEAIQVTDQDNEDLFWACIGLGRFIEGRDYGAREIAAFRKIIPALQTLTRFYDMKIKYSEEEKICVWKKIEQRQLKERVLRMKGDDGIREIYEVRPADMKRAVTTSGVVDFELAAREISDAAEEYSLYNGASRINPMMLGQSPVMHQYGWDLESLSGDISRNGNVRDGVWEAIQRCEEAYDQLGWPYNKLKKPLPENVVVFPVAAPG